MVKLLVIKPSSLGDVIHGLPALRLMKQRLGARLERVSWIVNDSFSQLLELSPDIDRIIRFPRKRMWERGVLSAFKRELQAETYDVAVDFQGLLRSGLMSYLSKAPRRVGFADGRECSPWFYNEKIAIPRGHAVVRNLSLASAAFPSSDGDGSLSYSGGPLLNVPEHLAHSAFEMLGGRDDSRPFLAIGHSSRWNSKNWSISFFGAVLDDIARRRPEVRPWLLGAPNERERAEAVVQACRIAKPLNLAGKSDMMGLVAMLSCSGALLTNDSGPMHLAAALDVPTIALFGATDPDLTGPYGVPGRHKVFRSTCPASPCFKHDCPYGTERCSEGTDAGAVAESVLSAMPS